MKPRTRDLGLRIGVLSPGSQNAITDVAGVLVGHCTLFEGESIRTGVTAIRPHGENLFQQKVPAAVVVGNSFGKLTGVTQVDELGLLETPVLLANTLSVFAVADAVVDYTLALPGNEELQSISPVVGECNDGYLSDIRGRHIHRGHVHQALADARSGPVAEGSVGAGTGTRCLGWKGGIGTASRRLPASLGHHTVGVLVQTNFEGMLTVAGVPVGQELGRYYLRDAVESQAPEPGGSCMVVVATDAPLDSRQLKRLGRRAILGLAAVGSPMKHGSGEYVITFSTDPGLRAAHRSESRTQTWTVLRDEALSPLFQAVREATEEAILNSMFQADTVTGFEGHTVEAIPVGQVVEICRRHGVLGGSGSDPDVRQ